MLSSRIIFLDTEPYLHEWLVHNFGSPVVVVPGTPQAALLRQYLTVAPSTAVKYVGNTAVVLPVFKAHPASQYDYLCLSARKLLVTSYCDLFSYSLFRDVVKLEQRGFPIQELLYAFLDKNEMDARHYDVVRQIYYRIRKSYHKHSNLNI